jgi:hypothetical protein
MAIERIIVLLTLKHVVYTAYKQTENTSWLALLRGTTAA